MLPLKQQLSLPGLVLPCRSAGAHRAPPQAPEASPQQSSVPHLGFSEPKRPAATDLAPSSQAEGGSVPLLPGPAPLRRGAAPPPGPVPSPSPHPHGGRPDPAPCLSPSGGSRGEAAGPLWRLTGVEDLEGGEGGVLQRQVLRGGAGAVVLDEGEAAGAQHQVVGAVHPPVEVREAELVVAHRAVLDAERGPVGQAALPQVLAQHLRGGGARRGRPPPQQRPHGRLMQPPQRPHPPSPSLFPFPFPFSLSLRYRACALPLGGRRRWRLRGLRRRKEQGARLCPQQPPSGGWRGSGLPQSPLKCLKSAARVPLCGLSE